MLKRGYHTTDADFNFSSKKHCNYQFESLRPTVSDENDMQIDNIPTPPAPTTTSVKPAVAVMPPTSLDCHPALYRQLMNSSWL